jgi:hypothetical protein
MCQSIINVCLSMIMVIGKKERDGNDSVKHSRSQQDPRLIILDGNDLSAIRIQVRRVVLGLCRLARGLGRR